MMKSVKNTLCTVIALTVFSPALAAADNGDIVESVEADLRAIESAETAELDVDELVAADEEASLPLTLRKTPPALVTAPEKKTGGWWWKLLLSAGILTGALLLIKRRLGPNKLADVPILDVLSRKSVGVRSEICIVRVDGHRLLLGITPNSIQRLAALPDPDEPALVASTSPEVEPGFGALLKGTYSRLSQMAEDRRVGKSATLVATELDALSPLDAVPPPESSSPRIIVRDAPASAPRQLELGDIAGSQAQSLRASFLRKKAS